MVGADISTRENWTGRYTVKDVFQEPMILIAHLAALTKLDFMTGVLVLPQRQTVLVAEQAAELDVLTCGRLRLGLGSGWNPIEYKALGVEFARRGVRFEEQIGLLRTLWAEESVDFTGKFHRVDRAGIRPLPPKRAIPIWIGTFGTDERALARIGRAADGWSPQLQPGPDLIRALGIIADAADAAEGAGRDPQSIALEGRIRIPRTLDFGWLRDQVEAWARAGAEYVAFDTLHVGLPPEEHIVRARQLGEARASLGL